MIINLFAGPGCGKSTLALGLGYVLKQRGFEAAVITEEAKPFALLLSCETEAVSTAGRFQNEQEARKADVQIREQLETRGIELIDTTTHDPEEFCDNYIPINAEFA